MPLVIQVYHYRPDVFLPDGISRSADAAQSLAARGMAVLQIELAVPTAKVPQEGPIIVQRIDSAVEALAKQRIVDPRLVAATGFSRGGYQVLYAVTHPGRVSLAAAMGSDFSTTSMTEYLDSAIADATQTHVFERSYGGSFWKQKAQWLRDDPTMNADRSVTPFLITHHGYVQTDDVTLRKEGAPVRAVIGAFALNNKPIDYLYFGYSSHLLHKPLEIIASQEAMIDWMAFWLQGYEDPSPQKAQQYQRWRPLREQQAKSLAQAAALPESK